MATAKPGPSTPAQGIASATERVAVALGAGSLAGSGAAFAIPWQAALLIAWDVAGAVFLAWIWVSVGRLDGQQTKAVATREDPSRAVADVVLVMASVACLVGIGFTLIKGSQADGVGKAVLVGLAVLSVMVSWAVVHTVFTLRYAGLYYGHPEGGIEFSEEPAPDFGDFAYLAFTIGMTYQVSDTALTARPVRRTALRHALLSFVFGTCIVALTINGVAGLLK